MIKHKIAKLLRLLGIDFRRILSLRHLPKFIGNLIEFKRQGGKVDNISPILEDYFASAGNIKSPYFLIDSLVAKEIFIRKPVKHFDIGSRIDGLVGQLATFMHLDVADIRPLKTDPELNFSFRQCDLMDEKVSSQVLERYPSISSVHAIEHFGLGRYGDNLNVSGHKIGVQNICRLLEKGGFLYLGFPCGLDKTEFNSQRLLHPYEILNDLKMQGLNFIGAWYISKQSKIKKIEYEHELGDIKDGTIALICQKNTELTNP